MSEKDELLERIVHDINVHSISEPDGAEFSPSRSIYNSALEQARQVVLSYMDNTQGMGYKEQSSETK